MLANIAQETTNKDGRGWLGNYDSRLTVTSYCAYLIQGEKAGPPLFMDTKRNMSFNVVRLKGYRYMLPNIWD